MVNYTQQPNVLEYQPSDNSIDFVFNSNQYGQPNFSFIVETWIDGAKVGTDKIYPHTNGYATFNASVYAKNVAKIWTDFNAPTSNDRTYILQLRVAERYGAIPITGTFAYSSNIMVYKASLLNNEPHSYPAYSDVLTRMRRYRLPNVLNFPFLVGFRYANGSHLQLRNNGSVVYQLNMDTLLTDGQLQFADLSGYINNYTDKTDGEIDFQNGLIELEFDPCIKYVVMYVNKYGGFDYFSNIHNVTTTEDYTRYSYEQTTGVWDGNIFLRNYNQGDADYLNRFKGGGSIITNDIDDEDQNVVRDILRSTMTWIWTPDGFRRIKITNRDWSLNQLRFEDAMPMVINFQEVGYDSSIVGSINASSMCMPADYVLQNTLGTTLGAGSINSGASSNIVAPDGNVTIEYADGTPILTEPIPSGVSKTVSVPTPSGWYRPSEWIELPVTPSNEKNIKGLFATFDGLPNWLSMGMYCNGGCKIEIFDGTNPTPFFTQVSMTYTTLFNNLTVNYSDCLPTTSFRGYRQCYFIVTPNNQSEAIEINFSTAHATYGSGKTGQILELEFNNITINSNHNMGASGVIQSMLEHVTYNNAVVDMSANFNYWFYLCTSLQSLEFNRLTTIGGGSSILREAFRDCSLRHLPSNLKINSVGNIYYAYTVSNLEIIEYDYAITTTYTAGDFTNSRAKIVRLLNTGGKNLGNFTSPHIVELTIGGYNFTHSLNGNCMFGSVAFMAYANSLGTANSGASIMMSIAQYNSFGGIGSAVDLLLTSKGWSVATL